MKIQVLVSSALVNEETGQRAGLYETVDVPADRAEYLISVRAARAVDSGSKKAPAKKAEPEKEPEPPAEKATEKQSPAPKKAEPQPRPRPAR